MSRERQIAAAITGSGSYVPARVVPNSEFLNNEFFDAQGSAYDKGNEEIIEKFRQITGIESRRYVTEDLSASDIGYLAARDALESSGTDKETLDCIIVAHNFGDVAAGNRRSEFVPTLAARIKHKLGIENPFTVAYDLPFGCPGWLQGMIQADCYIRSGDARRVLVIGAETLSRVSDPHDRDSMLYSDGAGATLLEARENNGPAGVLAHRTRSDTGSEVEMLKMDVSYNPRYGSNDLFLKMNGRKLYEYALKTVPQVIRDCIGKAGLLLEDIRKLLIHQANAKMDQAMLERLFGLYGKASIPESIMPMTIREFGNNSVATLPILYDLIVKGKIPGHSFSPGDCIVFASVGAGMNVNALVYRF